MAQRARLSLDLSLAPGTKARRWMPTLAAGLSLGEYARSLVRRLALLAAVLLAAIWALDGRGYFWPAWAWLGLGVLVLLDYAADSLTTGMEVCQELARERPTRSWPEQVLPYGLAPTMLITPTGWTLTESTRAVRLPRS